MEFTISCAVREVNNRKFPNDKNSRKKEKLDHVHQIIQDRIRCCLSLGFGQNAKCKYTACPINCNTY